jgi:hypothetical protein
MQIDLQLDTSSFVTIYYHINTGLTRNTNDDDNARNREVFTERTQLHNNGQQFDSTITWPIISTNARTILDEVTKWFLTRERHPTRLKQCCGSGSAFNWLSWIRIRIGNAQPDPGAYKLSKINK